MRPTSIFISSTCYDLRALREHLMAEITSLGHDPVLSEYASFPVSPSLSTVDNCKKVVRERADIFVLIIGGKRGSLDPSSGKSVVNSEYREAKLAKIDCLVFVDKSVWDLRLIHKNNPKIDLGPVVEDNGVFDFLGEVESDSKWVFPFSRTEEIISSLKIQLSIRFRELITRMQENRLIVPADFAYENESIVKIATDKYDSWEYRLACEILKDRLLKISIKYEDLNSGFVFRRQKYISGKSTPKFIRNLLSDISNSVKSACEILNNQLMSAFGPSGMPGDAVKIKRACDNLYGVLLSLYDLEMDVRFSRPHEAFDPLFKMMHGWTSEIIKNFETGVSDLDKLLSDTDASGVHVINLVFEPPSGLSEFDKELSRLSSDRKILEAINSE
ncbi:MAG: DUF4062 domain-containing protein [Lysobacteraceae bacterium]